MTQEEIVAELKQRIDIEKENLKGVQDDIRTPGFNQVLGAHDALVYLLEWIENG